MAATAEGTHVQSRPESATTLRTIVELVRRITRADVTSIVSLSATDKTITWKAASGFRAHVIDEEHQLVQPLAAGVAGPALETDSIMILQGMGTSNEFPANEFPVHTAEGIRDLAFVPLNSRGHTMGALLAGY